MSDSSHGVQHPLFGLEDVNALLHTLGRVVRESFVRRVSVSEDPRAHFRPSPELVRLVAAHSVGVPQEELALLSQIAHAIGRPEVTGSLNVPSTETDEREVARLGDHIERFFTTVAHRSETVRFGGVALSDGTEIHAECCRELVDWLDLNVLYASEVLGQLHAELIRFLDTVPRERRWGHLELRDGQIMIQVGVECWF